jgi:hypothetical protein
MSAPAIIVLHCFACPREAHAAPNVISTEKRGRKRHMPSRHWEERRRHRGEAAEGEGGDATPDLLFKHSDATLVICVRRQTKHLKHASKTLTKTLETIAKTYATSK